MSSSSSTLPTTASATTLNLHFSPEWMRTGATSTSKLSPAPGILSNGQDSSSPTTNTTTSGMGLMTPAPSSIPSGPASSSNAPQALAYSSLLTPAPTTNPQSKLAQHASIDTDPFRYSRDAFLSIYRAGTATNGGPGWRLGIEVERHEGVVVDAENTPACAKEMTDAEVKLYAMPSLNSRRPSVSHAHSHGARDNEPVGLGILGRRGAGGEGLSMGLPSSSSRNSLGSGGPASPLRERFSRRDSTGTTQPYRPRQLINTATATTPGTDGPAPVISPRNASGGFGFGGGPGFDGVLSAGEGWGGRRRGPAGPLVGAVARQGSYLRDIQEKTGDQVDREQHKELHGAPEDKLNGSLANGDASRDDPSGKTAEEPAFENWEDDPEIAGVDADRAAPRSAVENDSSHVNGVLPKPPNPADVKWQYIDDQQVTQGPFAPEDLTVWEKSGWLRPDLRMNRPEYDTLFLPLSTWKERMKDVKDHENSQQAKGIFYVWFEPIHENKPEPKKVIQPPPGLARQDTLPLQTDGNASLSVLKAEAPVPSVFEALRRADHAPSPVFGDNGFSHSPVSSHRLSMKGTSAALDSTHTSSPASSTANMNIYGEPEYAGIMRQPQALHHPMGYPHVPLPTALTRGLSSAGGSSPLVGYSSPIASYSAGAGELGTLGMQPPFSNSGVFANIAMRKPSYEQYPSPNAPWQSNVQGLGHAHRGSNLASGGTGIAATNSTTSSLSNVPRAHFGGRRSPSPASGLVNGHLAGGLAGALGGEVYDGTLGALATHTAIGRVAAPGGYSPQQQFGTLYRSPVPPIPEMNHGIEAGIRIGSGNTIGEPGMNDPYSLIPQGHALSTLSNDPSTALPRRPSVEPMSESWGDLQQQSLQQQQEQRAQLQLAEVQKAKTDFQSSESAPMESQPIKDENEKSNDDIIVPEAVAVKPSATAAVPQDVEDENSKPFIPVKKQQRPPPSQAPEPSLAPVISTGISTSVSAPVISQSSSKMTVPLASLITNAPPAISSPTTAPPAKAWATVVVKDEAKGLKEIQEAEARRAKENEKFKARPTPTPAMVSPGGSSPAKDEEVGTLLTWGLPTSLAGARASKEATAASSANAPPAVWAASSATKAVGGGASNGAKKATMKDIQEEEEKRKKKEREIVTAAKRVSEKTTNPAPAPSPVIGVGSAWATVGAGGKATRPSTGGSSNTTTAGSSSTPAPTGIAALPPRPSAAAIAGSGMQAAHTNATATTARPAAGQTVRRPAASATISTANIKAAGKSSAADDTGVGHAANVSPDTLKWMRETLKGKLVKGITVEEVIGLVLMMNEEDDIADTIYQSSPTLPGKRFAAEFMERRRGLGGASANSGPTTSPGSALSVRGGAGSAGSGAESAGSRLQPSASQDAFGFKVVKKKGKSGKA